MAGFVPTDTIAHLVTQLIPPHEASFTLTHNPNRCMYETVAEYEATLISFQSCFDWISPAERKKALESNQLWTCRWYPITPIGFIDIWASSLEAILHELARLKANPGARKP